MANKEAEKRGRALLATIGLTRLSSSATLVRSEIFAYDADTYSAQERKELALATMSTKWQSALLDRMVDQGLLQATGTRGKSKLYICDAPNKLRAILKDHDEYGFKLLKLLYPGEVIDPTESVEEEPAEQPAPEPFEEPPAPTETTYLAEMVDVLTGQRDALNDISTHMQTLVNDQAAIKKRQQSIEKLLGDMNSALNGAVRKMNEQTDSPLDIDALKPLFDGLESRITVKLSPVLAALDTTKTAAIQTHGKVESVLREFKALQKDKLGRALEDLRAITDLVADSLQEEADEEGGR